MAGLRGHAPVSIHTFTHSPSSYSFRSAVAFARISGRFLALALVAPVRNFVLIPFIFPSGLVWSGLSYNARSFLTSPRPTDFCFQSRFVFVFVAVIHSLSR